MPGSWTQVVDIHGADGGGRTHTLLRVPDFESSASANSATSASAECQPLKRGWQAETWKPHRRARVSWVEKPKIEFGNQQIGAGKPKPRNSKGRTRILLELEA